MTRRQGSMVALSVAWLVVSSSAIPAETIRYEGELFHQGVPATGLYDFRFRLQPSMDSGPAEALAAPAEFGNVVVEAGRFTILLDFDVELGDRDPAWIAVEVARADGIGGFFALDPPQKVGSRPSLAPEDNFPSGTVVFFDLDACPAGWSELQAARGRSIVGLLPGGTLGGQVGNPLTDLELRTHVHEFTATTVAAAAGSHNHAWASVYNVSGGVQWTSWDTAGTPVLAYLWTNGIDNAGTGIYPLAADPDATFYTDIEAAHSHQVYIPPTATTPQTGLTPYLQLRVCRKD